MKNVSFEYLMFAGLSAAAAAFCCYVVYLDSFKAWGFAAFGLLFSVLPALALIRILASEVGFFARIDKKIRTAPAEQHGFGPRWMVLIGMIVIALIIISVVVNVMKSLV